MRGIILVLLFLIELVQFGNLKLYIFLLELKKSREVYLQGNSEKEKPKIHLLCCTSTDLKGEG